MKRLRFFSWLVVAALSLIMVYLGFMTDRVHRQQATNGGGPVADFSLRDHQGELVTSAKLRGSFLLVYFGYSFCPDVCPAAMDKLTLALEMLEADGVDTSPLIPVFITVDPARDTAAELAKFRTLYHPRLITLRGTEAELAAVAKTFGVYYKRVDAPDSSAGYLMEHLDVIFVMDRQGGYNQIFSSRDTPETVAVKLGKLL